MKQWRFVFVLLLLLITASLFRIWATHVAPNGGGMEITIGRPGKLEKVVLNMGKIYYGQTKSRMLGLSNGTELAMPLGWQVGCGCTKIKLLGSIIPPNGRSSMQIAYSGTSPSLAGPVRQPFLIFEATPNATPEVRGTVKAFLVPSLRLSRRSVAWHYIPGTGRLPKRSITVHNLTGNTVSVAWGNAEPSVFFSEFPKTATVAPGARAEFTFRPLPSLSSVRRAKVATITLHATVDQGDATIPLLIRVHAYAFPEPAVRAVPGALVISLPAGQGAVTRSISLVPGAGRRVLPRVLGVSTSSPALRAGIRGSELKISLHLAPGQHYFEGGVRVAYVVGGAKSRLDVPVFATVHGLER